MATHDSFRSSPSDICVSHFTDKQFLKNRKYSSFNNTTGLSYETSSIILKIKRGVQAEPLRGLERKYKGKLIQLLTIDSFVFHFNKPAKSFRELKKKKSNMLQELIVDKATLNLIDSKYEDV